MATEMLDEGEGIPQADLERVFDKFFRVQGAGALAICRGFVESAGSAAALHDQLAARVPS